ncbi:AGAP006884-PA-like protein [Anopheles sinensis]|uniref:AGAP006884-PA-like protein n=1 Tax=Anopheles sinensis TaxID=74873 RepID=A0A084W689_ANOSI|nr:AGAP006884-PA-like protein [Anopheles sinensis]
MFKKLKEKITEEVKQSPQRFEQISKGLQAAVSSASSTTSEVSGSENFFSITEDDTPQNSPQRANSSTINTPVSPQQTENNVANTSGNSSVLSNVSLNNGISPNTTVSSAAGSSSGGGSAYQPRARRLSNSSMASDVSFRLPAYDSPAIYHLETDVDVSASETESVAGSVASNGPNQLDLVSKDKLFQAYKKALDRYQKYRERYTELARRYRELEKDNTKARAVLVETQDKALRRMSELREQCVLEQQAKAHLDSAHRMEIDELQCVVKTLRSKLELVGENGNLSGGERDLISLTGEDGGGTNGNGGSPVRDTGPLEERIKALESKLNEELRQKAVLSLEVSELKKREEEHTITIAENKMAIHSELEAKEAEVRKLKEQLGSLEKNMKQTLLEKDGLGKELSEVRKVAAKTKELESTLHTCNEQKNKLESKFIDFERTIMELEKERQQLKATNLTLDYEKNELNKKATEVEGKLAAMVLDKDRLAAQVKELEQAAQSLDRGAEIESLKKELEQATQRADSTGEKLVTAEQLLKEKEEHLSTMELAQKAAEEKVQQTEQRLADREKEIERLQQQQLEKDDKELAETREKKKLQQAEEELAAGRKSQALDQEKLVELTKALDAAKELHDRDRKSNEASVKEVFERNGELSEQVDQFKEKLEKVNGKFKKISEEKESLRTANDELAQELKQCKAELKQLTAQKQTLSEEVRNLKIINENSESEALRSLQESMRASMAAAEEKLLETTRDLNHVLELKSEENRRLSEEREELAEKLEVAHREKTDLEAEGVNLRSKIDTIRGEKKDLEKTLEREIREKTELKAQVTNILQEIGRLEEQLKDVKDAHSKILEEKQTLEEKIERLQREHCEARVKLEKDTLGKLQGKLREQEVKLQEVECENSQLAEKNCLLEESSRRTAEELRKLNVALKAADDRLQEQEDQLRKEIERSERLEAQVKTVTDQLGQCTGDHAKLFNEKELLDHQHRSLQDAMEAKEKEKLCVLDTNKCLEEELAKVRTESEYLKGKHNELKALLESDKRRLMDQNDALQRQMEELAKEKQSLGRNATDLEKRLASYEEVKIENEYLNTFTKQLQGELQEAKGKLAARDTELGTVRTKQSQTEAMLEERDQEITKLINEFVAKEKKQDAEQRQKMEELTERHRTELESLRETVRDECERKFAGEKQSLETNARETWEEQLKEANAGKTQLEVEVNKLRSELEERSTELDRLKSELSTVAELKLENENYVRDLDELKSELNGAIADKLRQVEDAERQQKSLREELRTELEKVEQEKTRLVAENGELRTRLEEIKAETDEAVRRFESEIEQLKREPPVVKEVVKPLQETDAGQRVGSSEQQSYDELRNKKEELENKLKKIMHEVQDVSNRNLFLEQKCENYLILEQSNERLKLANDKLSRQLDETLVSMHHNEGIAANTEFEYLRNILFQYLSGSVTGNNSTLVKVIAAVLKFSPQQTQVVIEKEAHRRSLMGQINNLL